ncbi:diacylglycerol/lipid kinase family protein [Curtobacterium sp. S6]|uniref:diacylglycerol/lipid kinase family protein n=1 Tax=Curtobacterium sp. S6 TaxID=1479623 RepID=UPI0006923021|nr:diacylglycerol kinase family protein [Curtobacterium sp. S6]
MRLSGKAVGIASFISLAAAAAASVVTTWRGRPPLLTQAVPWRPRLEAGMPRKVGVVYNPVKSLAHFSCDALTHATRRVDWPTPLFYETTSEDPGHGMAEQALADGCDLVIAMGGDGTVRQVAEVVQGTSVGMGIVPLGTGNLLARNLELPISDLLSAIDTALHGRARRIDMIHLDVRRTDMSAEQMTYLVMGGAGFDAKIMTDTREDLKSRWGWLAYVEAGMRNLVSTRRPVAIQIDDEEPIRRRIQSVLVANCGEITAGLHLASRSTADDGLLEVILLTPRNLIGWASLARQVVMRNRNGLPVIDHLHGSRVVLDFGHHPQPVEIDGDLIGTAERLVAEVQPGVLSVNTYPEAMTPFRSFANLSRSAMEPHHRWNWRRLTRR